MESSKGREGKEGNDVNIVNEFTEVNETVVVQTPSAGEKVLQQEFAQFLGVPSAAQKKILANLTLLQQSLRGPDTLLSRGGYGRAIPVPPKPAKPAQETGISSTRTPKR
ncbi:MAG: hypothetical protein WA713_20225 [Candidatus Acidiferrales bacterium]|jgi:hypothetical protein